MVVARPRRHRRERVGGVVDVGIGQRAGRGRRAGRGVVDTAGFRHRAAGRARDHRRIVGAMDGDGHQLRGAVDGGDAERIGQRAADIERLHRRVAVVERVGPGPARRHLEGAVAVGGRSPRRHCRERVDRVVDVGIGQRAGRGRRAGRGVVDAAGFRHRAADRARNHRSIVH